MSHGDVEKSQPPHLASALSIDPTHAEAWRPEELAAILGHQLDTPLATDLGDLRDASGSTDDSDSYEAGSLSSMTFGQLLTDVNPPLPLLGRAKRFAKACKSHADGPLPVEVATVLYYACIAAALLRCNARISALDEPALRKGLEWSASRPWLDPMLKELFERASKQISSG